MTCLVELTLLDQRDAPPTARLPLHRLAPAERARFDDYRNPAAARLFALGRLLMRHVLAGDGGAREVDLVVPVTGKPAWRDGQGPCFNLSHAGDHLLLATCASREVGVDLERAQALAGRADLWGRVCSADEARALAGRTALAADEAFGRLWTRKEALAKAMGRGLHAPFARIDLADRLDDDRGVFAWESVEAAEAGEAPDRRPREPSAPRLVWRDLRWPDPLSSPPGPAAVAVLQWRPAGEAPAACPADLALAWREPPVLDAG